MKEGRAYDVCVPIPETLGSSTRTNKEQRQLSGANRHVCVRGTNAEAAEYLEKYGVLRAQ